MDRGVVMLRGFLIRLLVGSVSVITSIGLAIGFDVVWDNYGETLSFILIRAMFVGIFIVLAFLMGSFIVDGIHDGQIKEGWEEGKDAES
jgi:hypothetical protein